MTDITGRDGLIICKALAYAIEAIERLPLRWREQSDRDDMLRLLEAITDQHQHYRTAARSHLERRGVQINQTFGELELAARPGTVVTNVFGRREDEPS